MDTIFTKIINREIPATIVFEDDTSLGFLDIGPVAKGHTLLIPKKRYTWMQDTPDETISELFVTSKKIMKAMIQGLGCDYVQVSVVGEEVPHFHIHLIPRYHNDGLHGWTRLSYENKDDQNDYAQKIISGL
ncbi:HIT family protein [Candidatus Nomurabacteria bacterium]|nr:HIT family protein [Candidatus Nomurabacteria bacterium]